MKLKCFKDKRAKSINDKQFQQSRRENVNPPSEAPRSSSTEKSDPKCYLSLPNSVCACCVKHRREHLEYNENTAATLTTSDVNIHTEYFCLWPGGPEREIRKWILHNYSAQKHSCSCTQRHVPDVYEQSRERDREAAWGY